MSSLHLTMLVCALRMNKSEIAQTTIKKIVKTAYSKKNSRWHFIHLLKLRDELKKTGPDKMKGELNQIDAVLEKFTKSLMNNTSVDVSSPLPAASL